MKIKILKILGIKILDENNNEYIGGTAKLMWEILMLFFL